MNNALAPDRRNLLVKILGVATGSNFDAERAAFSLKANQIMQEARLSWDDIIVQPAVQYQHEQHRYPTDYPRNPNLDLVQRHFDACSDWERNFVRSVSMQRSLSPKQRDCIAKIAQRLRLRGFL